MTRPHLPAATAFAMEPLRTAGHDMAGESFEPDEDYGVPVFQMGDLLAEARARGSALKAGSVVIDKSISRMYVAAYLLTGSARQAEAVVSESIRQLDIAAMQAACLSWKAIAAAVLGGDPDSEPTADEAPVALPVELLRVARLTPRHRQCFVLRVLMAMPRHYCAGLLRMDADQVDANSRLAAQELASMMAAQNAN